MPLAKGKSDKTFEKNVSEMINAGYPEKQAVAAAYQQKRSASKDSGVTISDKDLISKLKKMLNITE